MWFGQIENVLWKKFNLFLDLFHEFCQAKKMSETKKVKKKIEKKTESTQFHPIFELHKILWQFSLWCFNSKWMSAQIYFIFNASTDVLTLSMPII